jgi:8-oxo-dGTP pyrophosphatase MutT (NUDIX family)
LPDAYARNAVLPMNRAAQHVPPTQQSANDAVGPVTAPRRPVITVATIIEREGRFLVIEEETRLGVRLNQPAGHVEVGESIAAAAVRETLEEAAWEVEPIALVGIYHWQSPLDDAYVRFTFSAKARAHDRGRRLDAGILRALWLTYDEIAARRAAHRSPLVLRSLDDYRAGRTWPLGVIASL